MAAAYPGSLPPSMLLADINPNARWYALQVRQRHEKIISKVLRNKGYTEFVPFYRARRRWSDRIVEVELPLFPGYIFCRFDPREPGVPIVSTPGVIQIVGVGRTPYPIEDSEIDAIDSIIASGLPAEPWPYLEAGTRVRIECGALAGTEGLLVEAKSRHRLIVSVTLLQRSVSVEIDNCWATPLVSYWQPPCDPLPRVTALS